MTEFNSLHNPNNLSNNPGNADNGSTVDERCGNSNHPGNSGNPGDPPMEYARGKSISDVELFALFAEQKPVHG